MNQNPYAAPDTTNDSGRRFAPTLFIVVLSCVAIVHGIVTRAIVDRVYLFSMYVHYGFGFAMLVILLWKHQRQSRAICNGIFWLMACVSFSISSYLYALGWAPNQKMILWMILIPTLTSELLMKVLDWFRRHWSTTN